MAHLLPTRDLERAGFLLAALSGQGRRAAVLRGDLGGGLRALSLRVRPYRRRRGEHEELEPLSALPGPDACRGAGRRPRPASVVHPPDAALLHRTRPPHDRLGRTARRRGRSGHDDHVVASLGAAVGERRDPPGLRRDRERAVVVLLLAGGGRRIARAHCRIRNPPRLALRRAEGPHQRHPGPPLDRKGSLVVARRVHALPAAADRGREGLVRAGARQRRVADAAAAPLLRTAGRRRDQLPDPLTEKLPRILRLHRLSPTSRRPASKASRATSGPKRFPRGRAPSTCSTRGC